MKLLTAIITAAAVAVFSGISARAQGGGLVVLGDSIATGYGLDGYSAGDNSSAQGSFANRLGALYPEYDNFARDGLTTEGLLSMTEDGSLSEALSGADTVVLSIGGNDLLMPMHNQTLSFSDCYYSNPVGEMMQAQESLHLKYQSSRFFFFLPYSEFCPHPLRRLHTDIPILY